MTPEEARDAFIRVGVVLEVAKEFSPRTRIGFTSSYMIPGETIEITEIDSDSEGSWYGFRAKVIKRNGHIEGNFDTPHESAYSSRFFAEKIAEGFLVVAGVQVEEKSVLDKMEDIMNSLEG